MEFSSLFSVKFEEWLWNTYFLQNWKNYFFCLSWSLVPVQSWSKISRRKKNQKIFVYVDGYPLIISSDYWDASSHKVRNNYLKSLYWWRKYDQMQLQTGLQVTDTQNFHSWYENNEYSGLMVKCLFFMFFRFHANYNLIIADWSWDREWLSAFKASSATFVYCLKLMAPKWVQNTGKHILCKNNSCLLLLKPIKYVATKCNWQNWFYLLS